MVDKAVLGDLWVWVLYELCQRSEEWINLNDVLKEKFHRHKFTSSTHVSRPMMRRGYVEAVRDKKVIRVKVTDLGREWIKIVEPQLEHVDGPRVDRPKTP